MQYEIDIANNPLSPEQLMEITYITSLTFILRVGSNLFEQINQISSYTKCVEVKPSITVHLKIIELEKFEGKLYPNVAVGGTFDRLHIGHQILLLYTVLYAKDEVIVGISGDKLLQKKFNRSLVQPLFIRTQRVKEFIQKIKPDLKITAFELEDPYGFTITRPDIHAIVVSEETLKGAISINQQRKARSFSQLEIEKCPTIESQKNDIKLSSTFLRKCLMEKNLFNQETYLQYKKYWEVLMADLEKLFDKEINKDLKEEWWAIIFESYSEYWRFYHTNLHIYTLLSQWHTNQLYLQMNNKLTLQDSIALRLSIFFHDIVYRPDLTDNQDQSLVFCKRFLSSIAEESKLLQEIVSKIECLIMETKSHIPSNFLSQILYDLDMQVLNEESTKYKVYAKNIKRQYEPLVKERYAEKRIQFLEALLKESSHFSYKAQNFQSNIKWEKFCLQENDL